jgi:hypothetical protein
MKLPGTIKALLAELAALPAFPRRVTVPTKLGPFVLEFGDVQVTAPTQVSAPVAKQDPAKPVSFIAGTDIPDDDSPLHPFQVISASPDYRGPS